MKKKEKGTLLHSVHLQQCKQSISCWRNLFMLILTKVHRIFKAGEVTVVQKEYLIKVGLTPMIAGLVQRLRLPLK